METIGKRIGALRRSLRMSQTEFGERIGVTQGSVSDWETGKVTPTTGNVRLAADLAGDPKPVYEWLLNGGDRPRLGAVSFRDPTQHLSRVVEDRLRITSAPKATQQLLARLRSLQREQEEILDALAELLS